jgi:type VI secretion system protein ImpH
MATTPGSATVDVALQSLLDGASGYSFYQLHHLLTRYSESHGDPLALRYEAKKSLAFPAADIDKVVLEDSPAGRQIRLVLTFMGLYGPSSPLPAFYTERLLHTDDDSEAMRQLLDMLNHHLIKNLQTTWEKYRYYLQFREAGDRMSGWLFSLCGMPCKENLENMDLDWSRLLRLAPLFSMKTKNAAALTRVLEGYFDGVLFDIEECVERLVKVPADQCHSMGVQAATMGLDIVMGDEVPGVMGKVRIHVRSAGDKMLDVFFPGEPHYLRLKQLIKLYMRDQYEFDLILDMPVKRMTDNGLGEGGPRMGWSCLLGDEPAREQVSVVV